MSLSEFILEIDFLTENECNWDFKGHRILLRDQWVHLKQRDFGVGVGYAYVAENCSVLPRTQVEDPC